MRSPTPLRHRVAATLLAALMLGAAPTLAAAASHVRGQITAIAGDIVTVKDTTGATVEVTTAPDFTVILFTMMGIEDLKPEDYLSIPSIPAPDGGKEAMAVNVFPPAMKGTGEGESPWDAGDGSAMTNATLATMQAMGSDHSIVVTHNGRQETIEVPAGTPISRFAPDPGRKLTVGEHVTFFGKETDGAFVAARGGVTADGSSPPI